MTIYKTIIKGRLEFGTEKSFDKVLKMYQHRSENYYRSNILLNEEDIFDYVNFNLDVDRYIGQHTKKCFLNTVSLLDYVAQFAVAGNMSAWLIDEGKILNHGIIEPTSDKVAVQQYLKGRELVEVKGKETEAISALNKAIEKFSNHAQAYERRGQVNFKLKNFDDAKYDFTKSIDLAPYSPDAFFGRANVYVVKKDYAKAIPDLERAVKMSIPLQPIYWQARKLKADCFLKLKDYEGALMDLKTFANRKFPKGNKNIMAQRSVWFSYGKALLQTGKYEEALKAFETVIEMEVGSDRISQADKLLYRGIARKKAGKNGFLKDWKEASKQGSKQANKLLEKV